MGERLCRAMLSGVRAIVPVCPVMGARHVYIILLFIKKIKA
jgi:hypothetical protein